MEPTPAKESDLDEKLLELSSEMDAFEGYTYAHGLRIAAIADAIGKEFNLAAHDRFFMQQAALVHDIGEMVMNRDYIKENRILTATERLDLQRHPVIGEQEAAKRGLSRGVQLLIRWHHEWWNGTGYPDCLEGEQIPLAARILRVADSFAALRDNRPRRKAMSVAEAKAHLIDWAGLEFDPKVVKAFLASDYVDLYEVEVPAQTEPASQPSDDRNGQTGNPKLASSPGGERNARTTLMLENAPVNDQHRRFAYDNE
jgi:HD-GYP domain-containing protein (c-di-GMP phosphodiesterase class II)